MRNGEPRSLKQTGWISGPVECRCTACDWTANFVAADSSVPLEILNAFEQHDCREYLHTRHVRAEEYYFSQTHLRL